MNNIILIGMPGAGKSTVGVLCAKMMNKNFVDTDLLIQSSTGERLWKTIERLGVETFLKREEMVILQNLFQNTVIATGGSVVMSEGAMEHLKKQGIIVFLDVSLQTLKKRVGNFAKRGIVADPQKSLEDIYLDRRPLYQKYADITIQCSTLSLERTAKTIIKLLKYDIC